MNITNVKVSAGRTYNHPHEQYSNLRCDVEMTAKLNGEDPAIVIPQLQASCERMAEDHKQNMLNSIRELEELRGIQREAADLERTLKRGQDRLEELRTRAPHLFTDKQLAAAGASDDVPM